MTDTELRIIVGVKYCFRYNQRNRRAIADENGDPIDLQAMPRAHRRRREKKLMTMDEVNERFPMLKYKAWMTARAEEGLPTTGGVAAPSGSRAASLRNVDGIIGDSKQSHDTHRPITPVPNQSPDEVDKDGSPESTTKNTPVIGSGETPQSPTHANEKSKDVLTQEKTRDTTAGTEVTAGTSTEHVDDDMEDDDQIQMAVPTEIMAMAAGDSCAICIDQLEDDEDVRGLTCGHAFHAHCLDPWLTSRRACCPLCKADYYVPKPRPEGEAAAEADRHGRGRRPGGSPMAMPRPPQYAFQRHSQGRLLFPNRFRHAEPEDASRSRFPYRIHMAWPQRSARVQQPTQPTQPTRTPEITGGDPQQSTWRSRMGGLVPRNAPRFLSRGNNNAASVPESQVGINPSPSQLEAGQR